ncbi:UDP-N-acetyl glucosamine 2-epimerase [Levilinea saccharolytica]|uniref:CDP-Glycerol:Poly(Glycerophosphate) glycerophosphotransferase n=1 Tax=Levilinea saccharolytica TaxID=229921 RepID=A0A0P6XAV9_9CHLR|nr:hypothetical protein [Levilinea saccharolytica]KPL77389.1 hypothetical protein ADN01_15890 [Levilinea saccharolytica]GAP18730.1 hypothetical protein LSAC_02628 [Levilinea saccharolytica]
MTKRVFISADHGLAIVYFLQSDVLPTLLDAGLEVVLLTDDGLREQISQRFGRPGLTVEGLRFPQARQYFERNDHTLQYWLHFLRWMGGSQRINTNAMDGHLRQMDYESSAKAKRLMPLIRGLTWGLRRSRWMRQGLVRAQMRFTPDLYGDLLDQYQPSLVVASTPGWRLDRYLLRQAGQRGVRTAAAIIGWDNPSSYRLPGARVDYATCWSEIQKRELVLGSDWAPERVHVGGIPTYDGYFRKEWVIPREEYFRMHGLDPQRKLISYACSFVTFSPNFRNMETLARLVSADALAQPSQLLIRLHPNHFMPGSLYEQEAQRVRQMIQSMPHVHLVEPVALGGELGYYSGEDMPEKASMMAHSDVFTTVYSTMVVETAIHDRPIVSVCLDTPGGWNTPGKFSLALTEIAEWPTHQRFREAQAGRVAFDEGQLRAALDAYLRDPQLDGAERRKFVQDEVTYTDGSAGKRTGAALAKLALEA